MKRFSTVFYALFFALTVFAQSNLNNDNFLTDDLAAMEVRGPVKSIVWNKSGYQVKFDKEGNMIFHADPSGEYMVSHDDNGCLVLYAAGAGTNTYTIDHEMKRLSSIRGGEGGTSWADTYIYNTKGELCQKNTVIMEMNGETNVETHEIAILEKDSHSNWIKRRVGERVETRVITYYTGAEADSHDNDFRPFSRSYTFVGSIGGDKNVILTLNNGEGQVKLSSGVRMIETDTYDANTGKLVLRSFFKNGSMVGHYDGTMNNGMYTGVFTNLKGGKVNFSLKLR